MYCTRSTSGKREGAPPPLLRLGESEGQIFNFITCREKRNSMSLPLRRGLFLRRGKGIK
jgi:hypothetical protein